MFFPSPLQRRVDHGQTTRSISARSGDQKLQPPDAAQAYLARVCEFVQHFNRSPKELGREEISTYLHHLLCARKLSQSSLNQTYSALKFFFETTMGQEWTAFRIPRAKLPKKLPMVLSVEEVQSILSVTRNIKHRAILTTMYSAGLRVREVTHLRLADIDSDRMQIRVGQGKGRKDRYTLLARRTLAELRAYCQQAHPVEWVVSRPAAQSAFERALGTEGVHPLAQIGGHNQSSFGAYPAALSTLPDYVSYFIRHSGFKVDA